MIVTDYKQEQEMEIEALEAILMDDFKGLYSPNIFIFSLAVCAPVHLNPIT